MDTQIPRPAPDLRTIQVHLDKMLKGDSNDILMVANPDINCTDIDSEFDPKTGYVTEYNHKDGFTWKYDGQPRRIEPGKTRLMLRSVAKLYAKHLADHMLNKMNKPTNSLTERPKVLYQILIDVTEYFEDPNRMSEGEKIAQEEEMMNRPVPVNPIAATFGGGTSTTLPEQNVGVIPDPTVGALRKEPKPVEEIMREAGVKDEKPVADVSLFDPSKPNPTKSQLLKEAFRLDIDIKGTETVEQLTKMIQNF